MRKRLLKGAAGAACFSSIILAGCETPDGGICVWWTLLFLALAVLSAMAYKRMEGRRNG